MSEDTTTVEEKTAGGLAVGDLKMMVRVIQVGANRGAYNAEELETVGALYKRIVQFLADAGEITIQDPEEADSVEDATDEGAEEASEE
jgi:hypothetical protein